MGGGGCAPVLAMVVVQVGFAGLNVLSKLALDDGMSPFVLIAYRQIVATLFLAPIAFVLERKTRMHITGKILFQISLCSIFGLTLNQILYFIGLKYSTPTTACALNNILPAITFLMAIPFGMETVGIRNLAGQAKVIGTALCVGGSMLMTFYKGALVKMWPSPINWKYAERMNSIAGDGTSQQNMALGASLVIASCVAWAIWFIIQAKMSKNFTSPYTSSALMCFMGSVQCVLVAIGVERKWSPWALRWNIRLAASVYVGLVGSALAVSLMSWCIERRGPLFVSTFNPLLLVIVAIVGWAFLGEKLFFGSVIGSVLIVIGLYMVLWGKGREIKEITGAIGKTTPEEEEEVEASLAAALPPPVFSSPHVFPSPRRTPENRLGTPRGDWGSPDV